MKRWVAFQRRRGRATRPLFMVEAETEREALCLASDVAMQLDDSAGGAAGAGKWSGPMVHVRPADEVPHAEELLATRRLSHSN